MSSPLRAGLLLVLCAVCEPPHTSAAELVRSVLGTGAGTASNGSITLQGTVGQIALGRATGPGHVLGAGYWGAGDPGVVSVADPPGAQPGLPRELSFGPAFPNPSRGRAEFKLALPRDADIALLVYDVAGRAQGAARSQRLNAGHHSLFWRNDGAHAGVYFARLVVDGAIRAQRRFVQLGR